MIFFLGRYLIGVLECHQLINLESFITTWKKKTSRLYGMLCCWVSYWFWRLRPEKKSSSRLSGGLCCCKKIMACSLRYWNTMILFLGRYLIGVLECHQLINLESFITTWKKKSSSRLSGGLCCWSFITTWKKKSSSRLSGRLCCWVSYWFWQLRPEKKKFQSSVCRIVLL